MTNATVAGVAKGGKSRKLTLKYQGGEKTVILPPHVPIVKLAPGDRSSITPGAHVFVIASRQGDGALVAERMIVGKGGTVPPM
jgi:hypothetical protein